MGAEIRIPVTVRLDPGKRAALDELAAALGRNRSYVVNEALDAYLAVQSWQLGHLREGLRQAEAGDFATDVETVAAFGRWSASAGNASG